MARKKTLDEQVIALMKEHNLNTLSFGMMLSGGRYIPVVQVHGEGQDGVSRCVLGDHKEPTIFAQVGKSIGKLNEMRAVGSVKIDDSSPMKEADVDVAAS